MKKMSIDTAYKFFDKLRALGFDVDIERSFLALDTDELVDMVLKVERKGNLKVYNGCFYWHEVVRKIVKDFGLVSKKKKK